MFEKLLALLAHGKAGLVAGVFVVGSSGLLVSGTIGGQNVDLTITPITQEGTLPSNSPSLLVLSPTQPTNDDGTVATGNGCSDEAHARNLAKDTLKAGLDESREGLAALDTEGVDKKDAKQVLNDAKKDLDQIRKDAQRLIQDAADLGNCTAGDDEDENGVEDNDDDTDVDDEDENGVEDDDDDSDVDDEDENGVENDDDEDTDVDDEDETTVDEDETATFVLVVDLEALDEKYREIVETALGLMADRVNLAASELDELRVTTEQASPERGKSEKGDREKGKHENKGNGHDRDDEDDEDDD